MSNFDPGVTIIVHAGRTRPLAHALAAALGVTTLGMAAQTVAATITVNTVADENAANGTCSLREAIANANSNSAAAADCAGGSGADTIAFDPLVFPGGTLTVCSVTSGAIVLTDIAATTIDGGGAVAVDGGGTSAIFALGTAASATFSDMTISNGAESGGGAVRNLGGYATLQRCTLSGNHAVRGGAIYSNWSASGSHLPEGSVTIISTTLADNVTNAASGKGGAIYLGKGALTMTNSTVTGNTAGYGGSIFIRSGTASLTNATLSDYASFDGSAIYGSHLGTGTVLLRNSILTGGAGYSNNCYAGGFTLTDLGGNIDDGTSCGFTLVASSFPATDPLLGLLANNGGPSPTMLPQLASPAIDAIACDTAPDADQRGVARPQMAACDIGAVESDQVFGGSFEGSGA